MDIGQQSEAEAGNIGQTLFRRTGFRFAALVAMALLAAMVGTSINLSLFYLHRQDLPLLALGLVLISFGCWRLTPRAVPLTGLWRLPLIVGSILALAAYAGHYLLLGGYDLSRDEQMAVFDAAIFTRGELVAPLGGVWRHHAEALNMMFMYPTSETAGWISAYLPLNAGLRTLFGLVGDAAWTGPAMLLLGAAALWGCAVRIWPDHREAAVVALLLYVGSAQVLFNAMTAYAMPAHLALNLCWLWLFLRRTAWADVMALAVGFIAVGLHQPIMHPMFAAPILLLLPLRREWRRAALYFLGYAAIGAFWAWWPNAMWSLVEADTLAPKAEGIDYVSRLIATLVEGDGMRLANMVANILRFFAWQHLLLLPLLLPGILIARKDRLAGALAGGILLTFIVMLIILPYQGHGFGYRYFHGLIGNFILLGVYGWMTLGQECARWRSLLVRTSVAGLVILFPVQAWMAHAFYAPFAHISAQIDESGATYAVVGRADAAFSADLVNNSPFLDKYPIRLLREGVTPALARQICASRPAVALVGQELLQPITAYYLLAPADGTDDANRTIFGELERAGCRPFIIGQSL